MRSLLNIATVFLFLQMPFFFLQYSHHLEGHLAELKLIYEKLTSLASENNLSLPTYVTHFTTSPDKVVGSQGHFMQSSLDRYESFSEAFTALKAAAPWKRPFTFLRHFDYSLFSETLSSFQVGLSLSFESLCYAAVGFLLSLFINNPFKRKSHDHV